MLTLFLEKSTIKTKFNTVVLLPFMIITLLLSYLVWQNINASQRQQSVQARLLQAEKLAAVAHHFAVERGLTAGYLARKGGDSDALKKQYINADNAAYELIGILPALKLTAHRDELRLLDLLEKEILKRDTLRQGVLELSPPHSPFTYYSNINATALTVLEQVMTEMNDPLASQMFRAYLALTWLKEKAGQERGALNGVFTSGELPISKAVAIQSYLSEQHYFQERLIHFSSDEFNQQFDVLLNDDAVKQVNAMRDVFNQTLLLKQNTNRLVSLLSTGNKGAFNAFKTELNQPHALFSDTQRNHLLSILENINEATSDSQKYAVFQGIQQFEKMYNPLLSVNASDWFSVATRRIDLLNELVKKKSAQLAMYVNEKANTLMWISILEVLFGVVLLVALFGIGRAIANKMVKDLAIINNSISDVSNRFDFKTRSKIVGEDEIAITSTMFNRMLDKLEGAIGEAVYVCDAIAEGDFSKRINGEFVGDLASLKKGINRSANSVASTMSSLEMVIDGLAEGRLDVRLPDDVKGQLRDKVNTAMSQTEQALIQIERSVNGISQGDFSQEINVPLSGTLDAVKISINSALKSINISVSAIVQAMQAVEKGDFSAHVDGQYQGAFAQLQHSINQSVKVNQQALNAIKQTFSYLAEGEFKTLNVEVLQGDFALLGKELNHTILQYRQTFEEIVRASNDIAEGHLSVRISEKFPGELGKLSQALNRSTHQLEVGVTNINSVMKHASAGDFGHQITANLGGDLATLKQNINKMISDTKSAVLDIADAIQQLSQGELSDPIMVSYEGIFGQLKDDTNFTIAKLKAFINGDLSTIMDAAKAGQLETRIDLNAKQGFYMQISDGINQIVGRCADVIEDCQHVMSSLANSDLSPRIEREYQGSFNELKQNTNASLDHLSNVIEKIKLASLANLNGIDEISKGNTNLSQRTEQQAASLEEINATMSDITDMVSQNADQAKLVESRMQTTSDTAEEGGTVVERAIASMLEINQASKSIEDIISVIDEIAFQTNLLALNAAVESARAGDSGRGFAVVAAEVRNLAQRSASSAKKITQLIAETVSKVEHGSVLVQESGATLRQIISLIREAASSATQIATESIDQQYRVKETKTAIEQLDKVTQSNSALVEQIASASQNLAGQSQSTLTLLESFKLSKQTGNGSGVLLLTQ
ncbi:hypothetical protein PULV_a1381 [Pseudoalteromonas ulvae UL12]|uniref:Chemotaxis protein n=1 Tax=Pseudoalteromonas ulvae TaxID=107327 RepID=A0A244CM20_PSEDV|nr:methyl-accepting chemotaxis protein [Pseudoalteromonas ulvae]MBE0363870.1 hypothetical protein [Pseudoalteromonas ulvae UL12]OUL56663.1 hypothetical protein B1199_14905 [Pseudoalteromonas ulvae]